MTGKPAQRPPLDELDHLTIVQMRREGETLAEIAETFHTSRTTIAKILARYQDTSPGARVTRKEHK